MDEELRQPAVIDEDGEMVLNMGPHHPSTHGVIRMVLHSDGEVLRAVEPDIGYLHRGIEKIAEGLPYQGFMPYTDRVDYLAGVVNELPYVLAVEKLAGIEVPLHDIEVAELTGASAKPAPMMGGPFVASVGEMNLTDAEPRAKDESWTERKEKPAGE